MASDIALVKTVAQVQFLGISGTQIAPSMAGGLELREVPKGVMVTSRSFPSKRILIFNANISHIEFREPVEGQ